MAPYTELPTPTSIRLLYIDANQGPDILCKLSVYSLSNHPTYSALSYTWGSPSPKATAQGINADKCCSITVDGQPFMVTRNLADFLRICRISNRDLTKEPLWIDAVCINQADMGEKTQQVRLMKQIYSQATSVFVWLGDELRNGDAARTLSLLAVVCKMCSQVGDEADCWDSTVPTIKFRTSDGDEVASRGIPWEERRAIMSFLRRTWFSRIWIVQEIVVAKSITVQWGEISFPWELLLEAASAIETTALGDYIKMAEETDNHAGRGCDDAFEHYHNAPSRVDIGNPISIERLRDRYQNGEPIALSEAIESTREFHATDKRDLIFALLGIVHMISPDDPADDLTVDYTLSEETVFRQAARYLWKVEKNYGGMLDSVVPSLEPFASAPLPSWHPDYRVRKRTSIGLWATPPSSHDGANPSNQFFLESSGWLGDIITNGRLTLGAAYVDQVERCGEPIKEWRTSRGFRESLEIILEMDKVYHNGQHRLEAFWRTLICNIWPKGPKVPAPADARNSFKHWITCTYFASYHSALAEGVDVNQAVPYLIDALRDEEYDIMPNVFIYAVVPNPWSRGTICLQPGASFHHAVQHFQDMKLFVTKNGYLGLGPPTLQPRDDIWYSPSSRWLYALRESSVGGDSNDPKSFLGAVYVHDLTNGGVEDLVSKDTQVYGNKETVRLQPVSLC